MMNKNNLQGMVPVKLEEKKAKIHAKKLENVLLVAIRIRGAVNKSHWMKKTLELLRLHKKNHAVLLQASKSINGMLFKVKDFIAYGTINKEMLVQLLQNRGRLQGNNPLTEQFIKNILNLEGFEALADDLLSLKLKYQDIKKIVPVLRLHPARGGFFKGIKKQYTHGGVLGFHGDDINKLVKKMI
ncbi:MAG: 50S ribosomal protein L30 [Candidatus Hodarchaeota archaeon]